MDENEDYFSDADSEVDQGTDPIEKYKQGTVDELTRRSEQALSVLSFENILVYINDLYMENGRVKIVFDTFPPVSEDKTKQLEAFILEQVDDASGSNDTTWFNRIPTVFFNCYASLKKRLFS